MHLSKTNSLAPNARRQTFSTRRALGVLGVLLSAACSGEDGAADGAGTAGAGNTGGAPSDAVVPETLGPETRPAKLYVPSQHDGVASLPLVFLLHGFRASGTLQELYWRASADAERAGYYLIVPDGTKNSSSQQFWNATPACCDMDGSGVDDVGYLTSLLDEAIEVLPIDEERVYFAGHSNGGFMSYRMACELSERVAAIMSLAGADFPSDTDCVPTEPVSVLQVHGDEDDRVAIDGTPAYPSAEDAVKRWALRAGCDDVQTTGETLDLESRLEGAETVVTEWSSGCVEGHEAALWRMQGAGHVPVFTATWMSSVSDWLLRHKR